MTTTVSARPPHPWVLSAFWFGTAFHWLVLLLILMPANVETFVGEARKGTSLGALVAIGAVMALILPPLVGARSDRSGRRLPYLRLGVAVNLVGLAVMGFAAMTLSGMNGFWVYVVGFLLVQFGNNYATAPYSALIPQLVPPEQRGRYSGVMALLQASGQLLGAVAAFAVGILKLPVAVSFVLIAVVLLVPALITMRGIPEATAPQSSAQPLAPAGGRTLSIAQLFAHQAFLWVFLTRVLFSLGQYSVQPFLQYYNRDVLRQTDAGTSTSIMLACIIVGSIVSALIGGRISDRVGRKPVIYVAGGAMAAAALLLLIAPNYTVALGLALFFGLGFGAFTSVDWALGSDAMPSASSYARDMGIWHVAFVAPQMTSAPQGALLDWGNARGGNFGYTLVFGIAAVFFIAGVLLVRKVPDNAHRTQQVAA
ncbi:MFS transporter [Deinococcus humi]|uniref:MFS family permease n=1 Tax=Deinococcus humi TaxID=662880 RepID=A0A7W8JS15_9DEIO|nr:MFS transporter [Deinococcus humi]MBB5362136.1 MFS family permease [Deinococcus humi]GGO21899.1 MFS transporter [Deinococcus humi]